MKRTAIVLSAVLTLSLLCSGCGEPEPIEYYSPAELDIDSQRYWTASGFQSETAPKEMTVTFDGKAYTGTYEDSCYEMYDSYATDCYRVEAGMRFGINASTGKLVNIGFRTSAFANAELALEDLSNVERETKKAGNAVCRNVCECQ